MESQILQELITLKSKCNDIKTIFSNDIVSISKQVLEKVDVETYEFTDEENQLVDEIEDLIEYFIETIDGFYYYTNTNNNEVEGEI